jgi:hypothetical protein
MRMPVSGVRREYNNKRRADMNAADIITALEKANIIGISTDMQEFVDSGIDNIGDWAHEQADGHENVIYYGKAEELYREASTDERDEAEQMNEDCGGFPDGIDMAQRFTILAYWIMRNRYERGIAEERDELVEKIEEIISELEDIKSKLEDA